VAGPFGLLPIFASPIHFAWTTGDRSMPKHEVHAELTPRLEAYGLDAEAIARLQRLWPLLEPHLPAAIDAFIASASKIPQIAANFAKHGARIHELELAQYRHLLSGKFDDAYAEHCQYSAREHAAIGVQARVRLNSGCVVMRRMTDVIARHYWFSPATVAANAKLLTQAIMCDAAIMGTIHLQFVASTRAARRKQIEQAIQDFGDTIGTVIGAIKEATGSLATTSAGLQQAANETLGRMASASSALGVTGSCVETTVPASENLSQSIAEIGTQADRGLAMARTTVSEAERTTQAIRSLDEAANHIGSVVELISNIASQTNLLALNATIEAARAGETGKGFAVVASEVKQLANQTSQATGEISNQVTEIQNATRRAVSEITSIAGIIQNLTGVATSIASAVEQQSASARQIASSMQTAAQNTTHTADEIKAVEQVARRGADAAGEIQSWTERLSARAVALESKVGDFFERVRTEQPQGNTPGSAGTASPPPQARAS
jgi:methyl-accepting chemotaxis protein